LGGLIFLGGGGLGVGGVGGGGWRWGVWVFEGFVWVWPGGWSEGGG